MKKNIKAIVLQLILLFLSLPFFAQEKNILPRNPDYYSEVFFYALSLYQSGAYEQAEVELKRYIFMQNYAKGSYEAAALNVLAGIYEMKNEYETNFLSIIHPCCSLVPVICLGTDYRQGQCGQSAGRGSGVCQHRL